MSDTYSPGRFSFLPVVTKNLLIINTLCYFAMWALKSAFGFDLNDLMGLHYMRSSHFYPFQFLTYMFMHANFEHLFFNMFALWMFGSVIENYWGGRRFIVYYILTGIGAALTHYLIVSVQLGPDMALIQSCIQSTDVEHLSRLLQNHQFMLNPQSGDIWDQFAVFRQNVGILSQQPQNVNAIEEVNRFLNNYMDYYAGIPNIVGASGSIYGLLLAFGVLFPNDRVYLYFLFPIRAKWFVLIFGLIELGSGIFGTADGVAHFAHLGGMVFGLLLIWWWRKKDREGESYGYYDTYDDDFSEDGAAWKDRWQQFLERRRERREARRSSRSMHAESSRRPKTDEEFNRERAENRRRIDEILDKVSKSGYQNLTEEEKDFLFKSSNKETNW